VEAIKAISRLMVRQQALAHRFIRYHRDLHAELAHQRHEVLSELRSALNQGCLATYAFSGWQRAVRIAYAAHPLCTLGSLKSPGGRFNVGEIAPDLYPTFSAIYLAKDKETALQELLGQDEVLPGARLTRLELALAKHDSIAFYSVSGEIETVLDVAHGGALAEIVDLTKDFTISGKLRRQAKTLPVPPPRVVATAAELRETLLHERWRAVPLLGDVPSSSQVFGQLAQGGGIGAVLYPSKFNNQPCLAIYPENLRRTASWLALVCKPDLVRAPARIDRTIWEVVERAEKELNAC
jgi:hypothetical protein